MAYFCKSLTQYARRATNTVKVGNVDISSSEPIVVQTMTSTDTLDTKACVAQIERIVEAGGQIIRLTAQGVTQAENLKNIKQELLNKGIDVPLVADIHFLPQAAIVAAQYVEKVRINPGNFGSDLSQLEQLIDICKKRGVAIRVGVNHGSLSQRMVDKYGDTPEGMVASAVEFLEVCQKMDFDQVVVSMKSSNVRVMVQAYRMLTAKLYELDMHFPLHLGVTEAGNSSQGRIKSAAGIGTLLADGIGDTIRVSLTEAPENEIPVAQKLATYFDNRSNQSICLPTQIDSTLYSPYEFKARRSTPILGIGGNNTPIINSELTPEQLSCTIEANINNLHEVKDSIEDKIIILSTVSEQNPTAELRAAMILMQQLQITSPVIIARHYNESNIEDLQIKASADIGPLLIDGFGNGIIITNSGIAQDVIDSLSLDLLQATRLRMSSADYIACPSCGRTLYDIQTTLEDIKTKTRHLAGVKIGVMGCIVNGPGEMADADYGYVGSGPQKITLYRGKEVVKRNITQEDAIEELINLIKEDGRWVEA